MWDGLFNMIGAIGTNNTNRYLAHRNKKDQFQMAQANPVLTAQGAVKAEQEYGIHRLVGMGVNPSGFTPTRYTFANPAGGFKSPNQYKMEEAELKYKEAQARKENAVADALEKDGQSPGDQRMDGQHAPPGQASGQSATGDGVTPVEKPLTYSSAPGIEAGYESMQKYAEHPDGSYFSVPAGNLNEAVGEDGTLLNKLIYNWKDLTLPAKVKYLKSNWNDPNMRDFKRRWLQSRPQPRPGEVVLWHKMQWKNFPRTFRNRNKVFADKQDFRAQYPTKAKTKPSKYRRYPGYGK